MIENENGFVLFFISLKCNPRSFYFFPRKWIVNCVINEPLQSILWINRFITFQSRWNISKIYFVSLQYNLFTNPLSHFNSHSFICAKWNVIEACKMYICFFFFQINEYQKRTYTCTIVCWTLQFVDVDWTRNYSIFVWKLWKWKLISCLVHKRMHPAPTQLSRSKGKLWLFFLKNFYINLENWMCLCWHSHGMTHCLWCILHPEILLLRSDDFDNFVI